MQTKRRADHRSRGMSGSRSHAHHHSAEIQHSADNGISKREKQSDHLRSARKSQIQIREQAFLVSGILCEHGRQEREKDQAVYRGPTQGRLPRRSDKPQRIYRPVHG